MARTVFAPNRRRGSQGQSARGFRDPRELRWHSARGFRDPRELRWHSARGFRDPDSASVQPKRGFPAAAAAIFGGEVAFRR